VNYSSITLFNYNNNMFVLFAFSSYAMNECMSLCSPPLIETYREGGLASVRAFSL